MLKRPNTDTPKPPTSAETVAMLQRDLAHAQGRAQTAVTGYTAARLKAEINPTSAAAQLAWETMAKLCRTTQAEVERIQARLKAAEFYASPEYLAKNRMVDAALRERADATNRIEKGLDALFAAYTQWKATSETITGQNVIEDLDGGLVRQSAIESEFRLAMARVGFRWAANGYLEPSRIPPLSQRIAAADAHILAARKS
jgi:hypothetical protein